MKRRLTAVTSSFILSSAVCHTIPSKLLPFRVKLGREIRRRVSFFEAFCARGAARGLLF